MPLYDYHLVNIETGEILATVPLKLNVDSRDSVGLHRANVPDRIGIMGAAANPIDMASGIMKGYHKRECEQGSRFKSSFTPKQIKEAWAQP